jgi:hypothetical protein
MSTANMPIPHPQRKQPTVYKQPGRINIVSMVMLLFLAAGIYVAYCLWPLVALRLRVKGDLEDVMNRFWRANLRGDENATREIAQMRKELTAKVAADGVKDKKVEFLFAGNKQRISIEARFAAPAYFPGLNKTYVFHLAPRAETDAARVDW